MIRDLRKLSDRSAAPADRCHLHRHPTPPVAAAGLQWMDEWMEERPCSIYRDTIISDHTVTVAETMHIPGKCLMVIFNSQTLHVCGGCLKVKMCNVQGHEIFDLHA
jgi:hypothetical protein